MRPQATETDASSIYKWLMRDENRRYQIRLITSQRGTVIREGTELSLSLYKSNT